MFLKKVTICGFKSFCDRVDFEFGPGITCIVGPNGCGKSNVVDALKWVLGEQSAHSLRGRQMADMIFNGSSTRKSSSLAQVDLVFDNADRRLPMDAAEITVSRKLYRSGESEYLVNQQSARLKDVRELFLDTGVGVEAYSVIEQGRVDSLLKSSPQDRRSIFEEAAGISRFKARRKEAERKLERTQQNLLRVADVVDELEKRLRSVKLQAGKARNYLEYDTRLRELRGAFMMAEFHRHSQNITASTSQMGEGMDRVMALRTALTGYDADESRLTVSLDKKLEQMNEADQGLAVAKTQLAAQEDRFASASRRREEQQLQLDAARDRLQAGEARMGESHERHAELQIVAESLERQAREVQEKIRELTEEDSALARNHVQHQRDLDSDKSEIIDLLRRGAHLNNEIVRLQTHLQSLIQQKDRLVRREEQIDKERCDLHDRRSDVERKIQDAELRISSEAATLEEKRSEAAGVHAHRQKLVDELALAKEHRSAGRSRHDLLADLERAREGVGSGTRQVLEAASKQSDTAAPCIRGLVADWIEADARHARLVELILGERDQAIVAGNTVGLTSFLHGLGGVEGRITAICLDRLAPIVNERDFSDQPGFVSRALDLVRVPEEFEPLARWLFAKTIVVSDFDAACKFQDQDVHGHRFVTLQGEVFEADGRIVLGKASSTPGLISRKSELRELAGLLNELDNRIEGLTDELNQTDDRALRLEHLQQELRATISTLTSDKAEIVAARGRLNDALERLDQEQPLLSKELQFLREQIDGATNKSAENSAVLESVETEKNRKTTAIEERQRQVELLAAARQHLHGELTEAKVAAGQLLEKRSATVGSLNAIRREISQVEDQVAAAKGEMERCAAAVEDALNTMTATRKEVELLNQSVLSLELAATQLRRQREELRLEWEQLHQSIKTARTDLTTGEEEVHRLEMALAEINVRRQDLAARAREELKIDLAEWYEGYSHQDQDWTKTEEEIAELRGKMERLGNVNLDALTELQDLEERHGFLTTQRHDLSESHRQLLQLIEQLNVESREKFVATLDEVRTHFRAMFRKLFGGGRADIVLENPDDVLESGVEIVAQPPGKDLQVISLMSGGEKSMTAIALLMSVFKIRPAPFAIMDEVDAALDEANNERFNRIVQDFVQDVQFIIITHSKWTMNAGDRLYGVTMQEPGISTRVSVELTRASVA
ncbi:MAG: chromosome segregation protein SMC [Planctomycetota bacterium]